MIRLFLLVRVVLVVLVVGSSVSAYDSIQVVDSLAAIKALPVDSNATLTLVGMGRRFRIVAEQAGWCKVGLNDTTGWIRKKEVRPWPVPPRGELGKKASVWHASALRPDVAVDFDSSDVDSAMVTHGTAHIVDVRDSTGRSLRTVVPGTRVVVVRGGRQWSRVKYDGISGWMRTEHLHFDRLGLIEQPWFKGLAALLGLALLIVAVLVWRGWRRRSGGKTPGTLRAASKMVLLVRQRRGSVRKYLEDGVVDVESCLHEIGLRIETASTLEQLRDAINRSSPDIIVVDYQFSAEIHVAFSKFLMARRRAGRHLPELIFYNVPSAKQPTLKQLVPTAHFLSEDATDHDLFAPITPLLAGTYTPGATQTVDDVSALEGALEGGGLGEILQFIEIGAKTGHLSVIAEKPAGEMLFQNGMIVHAAMANESGRSAVFRMLDMEQGQFRFEQQPVSSPGGAVMSVMQVLMEWAQERDESGRDA